MFTVLADALFTASRNPHEKPGRYEDWADRFVPKERKAHEDQRTRYNPYRDLW